MSRVVSGLRGLRPRLRRSVGPPTRCLIAGLAALDDPAAHQLFERDGRARLVIDRAGTVLRTSAGLGRLLGVAPSPAMPVVQLFADHARIATWRLIEAAMAGGAAGQTVVSATCLRGDGADIQVELAIAPVGESDGRVSGAVLCLNDATAQRQAEGALAHGRKLQAVGALAGGIAHDFNNLLQAVIGAAEALGEQPGLPAEAREDVDQILAGARRGGTLVAQLLAFARQQTLKPQQVAVNPAITGIALLLRRALGERVRLDLALEEPGRWVRIDPGQLDQVLVNLAVNARDAMPGGGRLTLRTGHRNLLSPLLLAPLAGGPETIPPGRYVTIEVADTGTGISPDVLPHIFEPFFTTRAQHGTGLGMSTVLGIVRQSGGFVEVETALGVGTTMRVLLPRSEAPANAPVATSETVSAGAAAVRPLILLVDDEAPLRRLAARMLSRQGWQVLVAESGEAALAMLNGGTPLAAIVSDMMMPGMDGAALVRAVRAKVGNPALPAIIASGYADPGLHDAIGTAATVYLAKPFGMRELARRVTDLAGSPILCDAKPSRSWNRLRAPDVLGKF